MEDIEKEITKIFNKYGLDIITDTPDFILADYIMTCLYAFLKTKGDIEKWYGKKLTINGVEDLESKGE